MFSEEQINSIFGNLGQLLEFQEEFLEDLERHVDSEAPHRSCVGDTFLRHVSMQTSVSTTKSLITLKKTNDVTITHFTVQHLVCSNFTKLKKLMSYLQSGSLSTP